MRARIPSLRAALRAAAACMVLSTAGCGLGLQQLPVGHTADGEDYRVTAHLASADNLMRGTEVRLGQQVIGRVHDLDTDGSHAAVELSLQQAVQLPENVGLRIELPSALGDPFVRVLQPPDPSPVVLENGGVIAAERTEMGPELESTLAALGVVLNGSGLDQLSTVAAETNRAFGGRGDRIRYLTESLERTLGTASAHREDMNRALVAANDVAGALSDQRHVLDSGLDEMAPTIDLLIEQRDTITTLVDNTSVLVNNAHAMLDATGDKISKGLADTTEVLDAMAGFNAEVGPALENMNAFISRFSDAVRGDYLVFDGALDVPGSIAKLLSGGRPESVVTDFETLMRGGAR
ncbi:MCE family protein [Rhodococcus sp. NPDC058521]|uniref:MCE family protein n=1 Tax=Rhodococcus sp. NPDC058521 TaxID=3346536 RepID=UPI0036492C60